jgi:hypothetical protein
MPGAVRSHRLGDEIPFWLPFYHFYPWIKLCWAVISFIPRFLWYRCEKKRVNFLKQELNKSGLDIEKQIGQRSAVVKYFVSSANAVNGSYFRNYVFCELLNN